MSASADDLIAAARQAASNAYAPYSNFHVGAALMLDDGEIITAANFENASYGLSLCAETVAIAQANSDGKLSHIAEIAVIGGPQDGVGVGVGEPLLPCGRCRQIIAEVASIAQRDIPIHCAHAGGYDTHLISNLLPNSFGQQNLT